MSFRDKLRALLDSDESIDGVEGDEPVDEVDGDETVDESDEIDGDEPADDADEIDGDEPADDAEIEGTPADSGESAEVAELRAQLIAQAEQIETLRNRLAAAGIEDDVEPTVDEVDDVDDTIEEDDVEAFDADYAVRQAELAELKKEN